MADNDPFIGTRKRLRQALEDVRARMGGRTGEPADRFRIAADRILEAIILLTPSVTSALNGGAPASGWADRPPARSDLRGVERLRAPGSPKPEETVEPDRQAVEAAFASVWRQWPNHRGNADRTRALWFHAARQVGLRTLTGSVDAYLRSEAGTESDYVKSLCTFLGIPELYSQGDSGDGLVTPMMAARKWVDQHSLDRGVPTVARVARVVREHPEVDARHMGDFLSKHYRLGRGESKPEVSSGRMGYRGERRHVAAGAFPKTPPAGDGVEAGSASSTPSDAPEGQTTGEDTQ